MKDLLRNVFFVLTLIAQAEIISAQSSEFEFKSAIKLSGRIAFSANSGDTEQIFVADLDARKVKALIAGPGNNSSPSWSPDGKRLAFSSDRDGNKEIYVANWEGTDQIRITNNLVDNDNPSWLPTGNALIYYADLDSKPGGDSHLMRMDLGSSRETRLFSALGRNTTPKVSPDGSAVAYTTNRNWPGWDICIWDAKLRNEECPLNGAQTFCRPAWSPSGKELVYSYGLGSQIDLALLHIANGSKKTLSSLRGHEYDVTYSPDGNYLLFSAEPDESEHYALYILELGKAEPVKLLSSKFSLRFPSWNAVSTMNLEAERLREIEVQAVAERLRATPTSIPTATAAATFTPTRASTATPTPLPTKFDDQSNY